MVDVVDALFPIVAGTAAGTVVADTLTLVAVVARVVDEGVVIAVVERVVDGARVDGGGGFQPRIVVPAHVSESTLLSRPHSL